MQALKHFLFSIVVVCLLINVAKAQEATKSEYTADSLTTVTIPDINVELNKGQAVIVNQNDIAPFGGYLLNVESVANIVVKHESLMEAADLALAKQRELDLALLIVETQKLKIEINAELKKKDVLLEGKESEVKRLITINKDLQDDRSDFWGDFLLVTGSAGGGIIVGIVIGLVVVN